MEFPKKHIYTVSTLDGSKPFIRIGGHWLERLGFEVGTRFTISFDIERGVLVLKPVPDDDSEPASIHENTPDGSIASASCVRSTH